MARPPAMPGIYVYSFPQYLRHPSESGLVALKVGHSATDSIKRFHNQTRTTGMPEDPVLLRVYPTDPAAAAETEKEFHSLLKAAGHWRKVGAMSGREWFLTDLRFLDQIARTLKLEIINQEGVLRIWLPLR
jgi:hypothetical protein